MPRRGRRILPVISLPAVNREKFNRGSSGSGCGANEESCSKTSRSKNAVNSMIPSPNEERSLIDSSMGNIPSPFTFGRDKVVGGDGGPIEVRSVESTSSPNRQWSSERVTDETQQRPVKPDNNSSHFNSLDLKSTVSTNPLDSHDSNICKSSSISDEKTCDLTPPLNTTLPPDAALASGSISSVNVDPPANITDLECTDRKVDDVTTNPCESSFSSISSLKGKVCPPVKLCPAKFRCTRCLGDVREPPLDTVGPINDDLSDGEKSTKKQAEPVILCTSPVCKAPQFHLACSGIPTKSQIFYNATNSGRVKQPQIPTDTPDTAWWNIPIRNSLLSENDKVPEQLSSSDALFGSFQLYAKDPMSSISSFICPSCDVEGSSRYLLEYFELFHAMKKSFYSRFCNEDTPVRLDRMSECVEARTGDGIIGYLARMHAIDSGTDGKELLDMCEASELNLLHMTRVFQFLLKQLPPEEQKQMDAKMRWSNSDAGGGACSMEKKRKMDNETSAKSSIERGAHQIPKPSPSKKSKVDVPSVNSLISSNALSSKVSNTKQPVSDTKSTTKCSSEKKSRPSGNKHPPVKGICYRKDRKYYEVKNKKKYLGCFRKYEDALMALQSSLNGSANNSSFEESSGKKAADPATEVTSKTTTTDEYVSQTLSPNKESNTPALNEEEENDRRNKLETTNKSDQKLDSSITEKEVIEGLLPEKCISYRKNRNKWQIKIGPSRKEKYFGCYNTYEEAVVALESLNQSQQMVNTNESKSVGLTNHLEQRDEEYKVNASSSTAAVDSTNTLDSSQHDKQQKVVASCSLGTPVDPTNHLDSIEQRKLDPAYLVGMSIMLFNPVDNSYHSGRIIDYKLNAPSKIDNSDSCSKLIIGRLIDRKISHTMYLVRFREGVDGRRVGIHQWIYLEEHAVKVGGEVCWAKISPDLPTDCIPKSARMSPYRPVQIVFRSMLERIFSLKKSVKLSLMDEVGYEDKMNVLAMGFGNSFSFVRITLQEESNIIEQGSCGLAQSAESCNVEAEITNNRPTIFPFGLEDPSWLNQIMRHVRLCDEDIGVAVVMAAAEQDANRRVRSGIRNSTFTT